MKDPHDRRTGSLFEDAPAPPPRRRRARLVVASTLTPDDDSRLAVQCDRILTRLIRGPVTNAELSHIALKYTSRISDLRKRGHHIRCVRQGKGLTRYALERWERTS